MSSLKEPSFCRPLCLAAVLTLGGSLATQAQITLDVSKVTCQQIFTMRNADQIPIWLSGYYHGKKGDPVLEVEQFKENVKKVRAICNLPENYKRPVMEVIGEIEAKKK